ncbi:MAG: peroxidase [Alphaproteobacteria bacterium]|nr:peroxidase [Alphaproteobacteria bacterium]
MPFFKSMPDTAAPPTVFMTYPELYGPWSEMSQALMNGPSPLSPGERELIFAYAAGVAGCAFVYGAHAEVAHAWGIEEGLLDTLLDDPDSAPVDARLKPVLAFVRKLTLSPADMTQADADAVFDAGWDEKALHDAIAVTARMCFMQRLVEGHGFIPISRDLAKEHAQKRIALGYVNMYPKFAKQEGGAPDD